MSGRGDRHSFGPVKLLQFFKPGGGGGGHTHVKGTGCTSETLRGAMILSCGRGIPLRGNKLWVLIGQH